MKVTKLFSKPRKMFKRLSRKISKKFKKSKKQRKHRKHRKGSRLNKFKKLFSRRFGSGTYGPGFTPEFGKNSAGLMYYGNVENFNLAPNWWYPVVNGQPAFQQNLIDY